MERPEIETQTRQIVVEHLGVDPAIVTAEARFQPDIEQGQRHSDLTGHLGCDSLDVVELTMALEEQFNVAIDDDETDAVVTFGDAVDLVQRKLAA